MLIGANGSSIDGLVCLLLLKLNFWVGQISNNFLRAQPTQLGVVGWGGGGGGEGGWSWGW